MSEVELNYIENALLFFIFNKVDSMRETDLITICKDFYDNDEIDDAKSIVFQVYNKTDDKINRKGNNKTNSDIQDIIRIIRLNTPPDKVKFCVTTCTRLPPVGIDHIDAAALCKQVYELRYEFLKLSSLTNELSELKQEINCLKQVNKQDQDKVSRNSLLKSPNVREIVENLDSQLKLTNDHSDNVTAKSNANVDVVSEPLNLISSEAAEDVLNINKNFNSYSNDSHSNTIANETVESENYKKIYPNIENLQSDCLDTEINDKNCNRNLDANSSIVSDEYLQDFKRFIRSYRTVSPANDNKRKSRHRKYNHRIINNSYWTRRSSGNSNYNNWRTNKPSNHIVSSNFQRKTNSFYPVQKHRLKAATGRENKNWDLFITRIDPNETEDSVYDHLLSIVGNNCELEVNRLKSRYNSYSSFRATVNNIDKRINLLDSSYWPKGILIKHFN